MTTHFKEFLFRNRNPKQTIGKNIFWLSAAQISRVARIVTLIYAARILGAAQYGLFSYALGVFGVLSLFADIGIGEILTRDIARHPDRPSNYFATSFWIKIGLMILSSVIIFSGAPYLSHLPAARPLIFLAVLLMLFDNMRELMLAYLRGAEKMEWETFVTTLMHITMAVAGFSILRWKPSATGLMFVYIFTSAITLMASIVIGKKILRGIFHDFRTYIAMQILKNSWPIALSGAFSMLLLNVDILMLGWWRTSAEIGFYAAGQKIIQIAYTLPAIVATGVFPALSAIVQKGDASKEKTLNEKSLAAVFLFTAPIIVGGAILGHSLFTVLYGEQYMPGVAAFRILLLNLALIFPCMILSNIALAHNRQKRMVRYAATAAGINIILNVFLIPILGIVGAAVATLIAQLIQYTCVVREIKKISPFEILPHLKKVILCSAIMGLISFLLNRFGVFVLLNIAISAAIYIALLALLKEKILYDITDMLKLIRKQKMADLPIAENINL